MSSAVDQLPQQPGDPEGSRGRSTPDADAPTEVTDQVDKATAFDDEFADEIRGLFASTKGKGLFGVGTVAAAATAATAATASPVEVAEVAEETEADGEADEPQLFAAPVIAVPVAKKAEGAPSIGIFLPRVEATPERAAPALTGLSLAAEKDAAPVAAPNLFVSSEVAPAEVAFVPAEEVERNRYRWLLILLGLLFVGGAIWLTWMASTSDTVDAPVTTVANVSTTAVATTEAPASTTVSTTAAPATTASTTESTVASTAPTTAAPLVQPTTPPRPVTTARRPVTTAAPATAPPTTAAPTTAATVPDVTFAPPTWSPNTTAAAAEPPAGPAEAPAEPAATAPAEPAAEG